jgi:hypothetical protein
MARFDRTGRVKELMVIVESKFSSIHILLLSLSHHGAKLAERIELFLNSSEEGIKATVLLKQSSI